MFMPPPPPPPPSGGGKVVLFTLLGLGLFLGIGFILILVLASSLGGGEVALGEAQVLQRTVRSGAGDQKIVVIPVQGMIVDPTEKQFQKALQTARADANVKAVVIDISSPGGTVTDSNQMYEALLAFKQEKGVPVFVHMDDLAASGGYYLACAADEIYAESTTITGSIGVLVQYPQLTEFGNKTGIRLETIVADTSPNKNFLDSFSEPTEESLAIVKNMLNDQHALFKQVVAAGRQSQIEAAGKTVDEVADGSIYLGPQAMELGLVDSIGFLDDTVSAVAAKAGLTNPTVVRYTRPATLAEQLGLASATAPDLSNAFNGDDAKSLAIELLHEATTPRPLYLYKGAQ